MALSSACPPNDLTTLMPVRASCTTVAMRPIACCPCLWSPTITGTSAADRHMMNAMKPTVASPSRRFIVSMSTEAVPTRITMKANSPRPHIGKVLAESTSAVALDIRSPVRCRSWKP